jgi:hypothetical protein
MKLGVHPKEWIRSRRSRNRWGSSPPASAAATLSGEIESQAFESLIARKVMRAVAANLSRDDLGAYQRIDFIDLVDQSRPRRSGASCNQRCVLGCLHPCCRRGGACPLAPAASRIPSHIPHKVFEPVRNVAAKHLEPSSDIGFRDQPDGSGVIITLRFPLRAAAYNTSPPA